MKNFVIAIQTKRCQGEMCAEILGINTIKVEALPARPLLVRDRHLRLQLVLRREDVNKSKFRRDTVCFVCEHIRTDKDRFGKLVPQSFVSALDEEVVPEIEKWAEAHFAEFQAVELENINQTIQTEQDDLVKQDNIYQAYRASTIQKINALLREKERLENAQERLKASTNPLDRFRFVDEKHP